MRALSTGVLRWCPVESQPVLPATGNHARGERRSRLFHVSAARWRLAGPEKCQEAWSGLKPVARPVQTPWIRTTYVPAGNRVVVQTDCRQDQSELFSNVPSAIVLYV